MTARQDGREPPHKWTGTKVLIAGASGLIGTHLAERLEGFGAILRLTAHRSPLQRRQRLSTAIEVFHADLTTPAACAAACEGMDVVFLCAAHSTGAADIAQRPLSHVTPNVLINTLMLEAAHRAGVRQFVFVSSCVGYPAYPHPVREEQMWTGNPPAIYWAAGHMKRYAEILCRTYAELADPPMQTVVVRPSNVYGPYDKFDFAKCHVLPALVRRVVERHDPLEVWGTGDDIRDLLYVDDCVDGMLAACEVDKPLVTLNLASGRPVSVKQILATICDMENHHPEIRFNSRMPSTIPGRWVDSTLARALTGWEAKTSLEDGLRRTIDWYRSAYGRAT